MNEHNFCMGCQYYNKPYWSIVSPCDSCPRIYGTDRFATTATTNIKIEKYNDVTTNLPTAKEYRETAKKSAFRSTSQWSEPKYQCIECAEYEKNESCPIYKEGHYCRPQEIMEWLQQPVKED